MIIFSQWMFGFPQCTDTVLRDYFLSVGASLLRRRNRYKHFYVFTDMGILVNANDVGCFPTYSLHDKDCP